MPQIVDGIYRQFIISTDGDDVRLCCGLPKDSLTQLKYRWFELSEGKENELQGVINNYFDIEFFEGEDPGDNISLSIFKLFDTFENKV